MVHLEVQPFSWIRFSSRKINWIKVRSLFHPLLSYKGLYAIVVSGVGASHLYLEPFRVEAHQSQNIVVFP